ncbi:MAG: metallophosphoesterase, partial [Chloroflexi bacterium]
EVLRHLAGKAINGLSPQAEGIAQWVAEKLTSEQQQIISSWGTTFQLELDKIGRVLFCHATPHNDIDVFTKQSSDERLQSIFNNLDAALVVCGHTHMQFDRTVGNLRVVNAGSVGMPFGKAGAYWLLIDGKLFFKQTDYDRTAAAERIRQTDYPQAESFAANNVLNTPAEQQVLDMLSKLEAKQTNNL